MRSICPTTSQILGFDDPLYKNNLLHNLQKYGSYEIIFLSEICTMKIFYQSNLLLLLISYH